LFLQIGRNRRRLCRDRTGTEAHRHKKDCTAALKLHQ
jgi:hypothetical protein